MDHHQKNVHGYYKVEYRYCVEEFFKVPNNVYHYSVGVFAIFIITKIIVACIGLMHRSSQK